MPTASLIWNVITWPAIEVRAKYPSPSFLFRNVGTSVSPIELHEGLAANDSRQAFGFLLVEAAIFVNLFVQAVVVVDVGQ